MWRVNSKLHVVATGERTRLVGALLEGAAGRAILPREFGERVGTGGQNRMNSGFVCVANLFLQTFL